MISVLLLLPLRAIVAQGAGKLPDGFVRIKGGSFMMGSPASEVSRGNDEIRHRVTVSTFYMGMTEVTQKEYEAVTGTNPSFFKGENLPVENVSWYDAIEYCNKKSKKDGLTAVYTISKNTNSPNNKNKYDAQTWQVTWNRSANGYRLPTEAEWEYACRAGTTTPFNTGNNITTGEANYDGNYPYNNNSKGIYLQQTTTVRSFLPNSWNLYDMHGNVWEWCWDRYGTYKAADQIDPRGASSGVSRILRGGSWGNFGQLLRSAGRRSEIPSAGGSNVGFRIVRPEKL